MKHLAYTWSMLKTYVRSLAVLLFAIGLWGFWGGAIPNVVQLDLFQSLVYVVFGAVGLKLGFSQTANKTLARYATASGIMGLVFLGFGLTFPNFFDIFHLEIPEHVFHALIGILGCVVGDYAGRKTT